MKHLMQTPRRFLSSFLMLTGFCVLGPVALAQDTAQLFDVTISLYNAPATAAEREPYEHIIEYFADGVFEQSNGAHKIRRVLIYTSGDYSDGADIVWADLDADACQPEAYPSGRAVDGLHVNFCDVFDKTDFLANDFGHQGAGYTLAHEWGHYFYSQYDEYVGDPSYDHIFYFPHSTDESVDGSIMHNQWNARGGDYRWLNFSNANNDTENTAQHRVYAASNWETLARTVVNDPRDGERAALPGRIYYSDLAAVAPAADQDPRIDLPGTAQSDLEIVWVTDDVTWQIVIDRSGSMGVENKMENAKTAAQLLVDLAEVDHATIGVISFSDSVTVVQPMTPIDGQATKDLIKARIASITAGGLTAIGSAAQRALVDLVAYGAEDTNRGVFLLTNGQSNTGISPLSVIPGYQAAHIPMYTFAYGSYANSTLLRLLADETGGEYYYSPTALADLAQVFQDATQQASPSVDVVTSTINAASTMPTTMPIFIDGTLQSVDVVITYAGLSSALDMTLRDPYGNATGAPACSYSGAETLCIFSVASVTTGEWRLELLAQDDSLEVGVRVSGAASGVMTYAASMSSLLGESVAYPRPILLLAFAGKELPITGLGVQTSVRIPSGELTALALRDDGEAPDARAGDGFYSAILPYDQNGVHDITVQFDNAGGTAQIVQGGYQPSLSEDGLPLPQPPPIDLTDNFQRSARIQVEVSGVVFDDHGDTAGVATPIPHDNTDVAGRMDFAGDIDMFRVDALGSGDFIVRVSDRVLDMNPRIRLLDADGSTVLADVDLSSAQSKNGYLYVAIYLAAGETVYAEVSHVDGAGGGLYSISVGQQIASDVPANEPPIAHPGMVYPHEKYQVPEGGTVQLDGSLSHDPDGDTIDLAWDLDGNGSFEVDGPFPVFSAAALDGPSEHAIYLQVCDEHGACDVAQAAVEVYNVAPTIVEIRVPPVPVSVEDQPVEPTVLFTDPGVADTHELVLDWNDGSVDVIPGAVSPWTGAHDYVEASVCRLTVTVMDDDGGVAVAESSYIIIYDPSAGFVTGGGWIISPAGAYRPEPMLTGHSTFGFVSKYHRGATVPVGNTEFWFHAAALNFHSASYEWLVVTQDGTYAQYKGHGTINGEGEFKFMLWAGDHDPDAPDTFRIKIWAEDDVGNQTVIYDNGVDQPIDEGTIIVHDSWKG